MFSDQSLLLIRSFFFFFATPLLLSPSISKSQEFCKSVVYKSVLIRLKMSLLWTQPARHICSQLVKQLLSLAM